jgi:hypothetical protein
MKSASAVLVAMLVVRSGYARAQDVGPQPPAPGESQAAQPSSAEPSQLPPAPPEQIPAPPPPQVQAPTEATQAAADGQWVYTEQYGWVWMPYGSQYTYEPTQAGAYPSEYVYYPSYGWTWLTAPWVFGWGAAPYFGVYGPSHFGWHNRLASGGWRGYGNIHYGNRPAYGNLGSHPGYGSPRAANGYGPAVRSYNGASTGAFGGHPGFRGGFSGNAGGVRGGGFSGGHFGGGGGFRGGGFSGGHFGGGGGFRGGGSGGSHWGRRR